MKSYVCITGAACGLGKAFAAECASRGWNLFLTDVSDGALIPLATGLERLYGVEIMPTNPSTVRGINAQGFMGQITTTNVGGVAARTIELALAGRSVYIPVS